MTTLQELINRMNAYTPIRNMDEVLKVNALDQAIRMFRMNNQPPWTQKKTTLRVFQNVPLYPTASDHAHLAMLDDPLGQDNDFGQHPRYVFTSLRDFLETPTGRNLVAEVWQNGTKMIGVRNYTSVDLTEQLLDSASDASDYATSGDAGTPVVDNVIFLTGSTSIRVPITYSTGTAVVTDTFANSTTSTNYKRNYFFVNIFLSTTTAPSAIAIRLYQDASNYLDSPSITTQFAGQPLIANDWNTIAFDLNTATATGTVTGTFTSVRYTFTETASGNYYFDQSFLRGWILQDYWYYSRNNVLDGSTYQQFFSADSATYDLASQMLGETVFHDAIMYEACTYLLSDQKESKIQDDVSRLRNSAWERFFSFYPDNTPQITTNTYRFGTDYQAEMNWPDFMIR